MLSVEVSVRGEMRSLVVPCCNSIMYYILDSMDLSLVGLQKIKICVFPILS